MSKRTAVEWLTQRLHNRRNGIFDGHPDLSVQQLCEIAIIMEREQVMHDFNNGVNDECLGKNTTPEQYYNETYGKEAGHE